jgi:hypothetical protein
MKLQPAVLFALALSTCLWAPQAHALKSLEDGIESTSRLTQLPSVVQGAVVARSCATCPVVTYRLSAESRFFVGAEQVSLADLRTFFTGRDTFNLIIAVNPGSQNVTRIVVQGLSTVGR